LCVKSLYQTVLAVQSQKLVEYEKTMSDLFQIENFRKVLNSQFTFKPSVGEPVAVELVGVSANGYTIPGEGKENFSLLFNDKENPAIGQGIVAVEHPQLGAFEMFVVPVIPERPGVCYESVFNFLPEA